MSAPVLRVTGKRKRRGGGSSGDGVARDDPKPPLYSTGWNPADFARLNVEATALPPSATAAGAGVATTPTPTPAAPAWKGAEGVETGAPAVWAAAMAATGLPPTDWLRHDLPDVAKQPYYDAVAHKLARSLKRIDGFLVSI